MPRPPIPLLSREAIVSRALSIIDADGVSGLSMRRLAAELGVSGPSLYHHFTSKDRILDAIISHISDEIRLEEVRPGWEAALTSYAYQLRAALAAHPHVIEFIALRQQSARSGRRLHEHVCTQLLASGWDAAFGDQVALAVESLVLGAALLANTPRAGPAGAEQAGAELAGEAKAAERAAGQPPGDGFETGFRALLAGLRILAAES